jgi:hypothetical protein
MYDVFLFWFIAICEQFLRIYSVSSHKCKHQCKKTSPVHNSGYISSYWLFHYALFAWWHEHYFYAESPIHQLLSLSPKVDGQLVGKSCACMVVQRGVILAVNYVPMPIKYDLQNLKPLKRWSPNLAYVTRFGIDHVTGGALAISWFVKLLTYLSVTDNPWGVRSSPLVDQTMCFDSRTCLACMTSITSIKSRVMGSSCQKIGDFIAWKELC